MATYQTRLNDFKNILKQTEEYSCISDTYTSVGSSGEAEMENPAKSRIDYWISEMDAIANSIHAALDCLFNNPDDEYNSEDINYQLINAYADGSSSYEYYDKSNDEFITKPEYFYVRGNLYDMLPKANEGDYIYKYINNIKSVDKICQKYQELYDDYIPPTSEDGSTVSAIEYFWNEYFSDFKEELDSTLSVLTPIKNQYNAFIDFIRNYKNLFYNVSLNISKGEQFISALNKTSIAKGTRLSDTYSNIGSNGFSLYSSSLGNIYNIFLNSISILENSINYKNDYGYNNLRKIYYSEILVYYNFFNMAIEYYNWILSFRKQFNI